MQPENNLIFGRNWLCQLRCSWLRNNFRRFVCHWPAVVQMTTTTSTATAIVTNHEDFNAQEDTGHVAVLVGLGIRHFCGWALRCEAIRFEEFKIEFYLNECENMQSELGLRSFILSRTQLFCNNCSLTRTKELVYTTVHIVCKEWFSGVCWME